VPEDDQDEMMVAADVVSVLIVDDQLPFRLAARAVLKRTEGFELIGELLDPRLVRHGRVRVRRAGRRLRWILAPCSVHLVELLGLRVVGLQLVVRDRPGRRDAVVVAQLAEVLLAQPVKGCPVELGCTADEVVNLGLELLAAAVVPGVGADISVLGEDGLRCPVLRLPTQPVAALEQKDPLAGRCEMAGERPAAGAGSDDDHVVVLGHVLAPRSDEGDG